MLVTLTNTNTGAQLVRYPSHHVPSAWTIALLASLGIAVTVSEG